jgi:hypothetical protein
MTIFIEKLSSKSPDRQALSPKEIQSLRTLFLLSFQYSQGNQALQTNLFRWNLINGSIPRNIPAIIPKSVFDITPPEIHEDTTRKGQSNLRDMTYGTIRYVWRRLGLVSSEKIESMSLDLIGQKAIEYMIKADLYYQFEERPGRPNESFPIPDSNTDSHKSFIRRYAVLGQPTGHPSYDALFKMGGELVTNERFRAIQDNPDIKVMDFPMDKRTKLQRAVNDLDRKKALEQLIVVWNINHASSGQTFFPKAA